MAISIIIKVYL